MCSLNSHIYALAYSTEQGPAWEADSGSANKEFIPIYGTLIFVTVFTRTSHRSLCQPDESSWHVNTLFLQDTFQCHCSILGLVLLSSVFPSCFPTNSHLLMCATCPAQLVFHQLIILTIFGEDNKLWSCSLCSFLQQSVTLSLYGPTILLIILFTHILNLLYNFMSETKYQTHTNLQNYCFLYAY
jgi:hypothetical protein